MNDYIDDRRNSGFLSGLSPIIRAVLICLLPFATIDFANYYTFGLSTILTCVFMLLIYAGCGALCVKFTYDAGQNKPMYIEGAKAGALLWLLSVLVNVLIGLVLGTASLGGTLLLGLPYLFCLAPFFLVMGGVAGGIGATLFERFRGPRPANDDYYS